MQHGTDPAILDRLEADGIHILREAVAQAERAVMLFSMGKDSAALLHLARKAFAPAPLPFDLLHVDTNWKFRDMYALRDRVASEAGVRMLVHRNPEALARGINPFDHGPAHTDMWKTEGLKQALAAHNVDVAIGGARRDEDRSRAKERVYSFRSSAHGWDPRRQRPELWHIANLGRAPGESFRVFPLSDWTEIDVWSYIAREKVAVVPLYFAAPRPVVDYGGQLVMVDDDRFPLAPGIKPQIRTVRFRTLGCYPLTGAVESDARDVEAIIAELAGDKAVSERAGRAIDSEAGIGLERRKREGYF